MMNKQGMELLKSNFDKVEEKFIEFFKEGKPRWPQEQHDLLRNHYAHMDRFSAGQITLDKLQLIDLPENILQEVRVAFEAFQKGEAYPQ